MQSQIHIKKDFNLIEALSSNFDNTPTNDIVKLPDNLGKGQIRGMYFPSDLNLYTGDYHLNTPWELETIITSDSNVFYIFASILSNSITIKKDNKWETINHNGPQTLLFHSPGSSVQVAFPKNEPFKTIAITFTTQTIQGIIDHPDVLKGLNFSSPFLYLDETVPEAERYINKLTDNHSRFDTYITLLNLLKLSLYRTFVIKERYNSSGLLKEDVEKLFALRKTLMDNSHQTIKIATLSAEIGMGQSKWLNYSNRYLTVPFTSSRKRQKSSKPRIFSTQKNTPYLK
ncbi:hypothetical protein [Chitinophaga pinensis]|uniref:hypothetical protein n=1 Tax=Chitinophaga pinensis TaxID=79329 RepID=UPI0001A2EA7F|nr:hypothetical protein [Chitinophaga pinensis]